MRYDSPISCKFCSEDIYFDDDRVAPSGRKIPISAVTDKPHDCKGKPNFNKQREILEDQRYSEQHNMTDLYARVGKLETRMEAIIIALGKILKKPNVDVS